VLRFVFALQDDERILFAQAEAAIAEALALLGRGGAPAVLIQAMISHGV
jgi:hypothetical protein